jgi:hypothetical protein
VFVKIPQRWIDDPETAREMVKVARAFLATTGRVVSVKFYVSYLTIGDGMVLHRHAFRELTNDACRFHYVPTAWNGMPPKWQRIFFWPAAEAPAPHTGRVCT